VVAAKGYRTYDAYVIFSDNVRTARVRYFTVRWPHYMTKKLCVSYLQPKFTKVSTKRVISRKRKQSKTTSSWTSSSSSYCRASSNYRDRTLSFLHNVYVYSKLFQKDWTGWCSVLRPRQHSIGYMGDGVIPEGTYGSHLGCCNWRWTAHYCAVVRWLIISFIGRSAKHTNHSSISLWDL